MAAFTPIDDPSAHFQVASYTGDGNDNRQVTNDGNSNLQPDWVWIKDRTQAQSNAVFDSSRGASIRLKTDDDSQESTESATLKSFTSDGFAVGTSGTVNNGSNPDEYVAFQWKANGGTTSTNTAGDINSTVQANDTAGFSIVQHSDSSNGNSREIGHGLSAAPAMVITRARNRTENWRVGVKHYANHDGSYILDNDTTFNNTSTLHTGTDSDSFGVGTDYSVNGTWNYISYVFREVKGYSKFGQFAGNSNSSGSFVYCGFKPALIFIKRRSNSGGWYMYNHKSSPTNMAVRITRADIPDEEDVNNQYNLDMYSTGFKILNTNGGQGGATETYFMAAFAERPFVTSSGVPTVAR